MPTFAKTYEECRKFFCVICMKKGDQEQTQNCKSKILQQIQKDLDFNDESAFGNLYLMPISDWKAF